MDIFTLPSTFSIVLLSTVLLSYYVTLTEVRHRLGINLPPVQLIHAVLDLRTALNLPPNLLCHPVLNLLHRPGINLPPVLLRHPFLSFTQSLYVLVLSPCMYLYSVLVCTCTQSPLLPFLSFSFSPIMFSSLCRILYSVSSPISPVGYSHIPPLPPPLKCAIILPVQIPPARILM